MEHIINKILCAIRQNQSSALATVVSSIGSSPRKVGAKMFIYSDGSIVGTIGGGALEKSVIKDALGALKKRQSFLKTYSLDERSGLQICGGKVSIFFEVITARQKLVICGGGHIGLALYCIGVLLKFHVVIIDNRREYANKKRFFQADRVICGAYSKAIRAVGADEKTSIVIVTHGHAHDEECLAAALKTGASYIGMIGSQAKIRKIFASLRTKGFKDRELSKVYSPVGLDIGAETPEEIAVAIAAEIIWVNAEKDSFKVKPFQKRLNLGKA